MSAELAGVEAYRHPGLPPACAASVGGCALGGCEGLRAASVVETMSYGYRTAIFEDTGKICPELQVSMPDGSVYRREVPLSVQKARDAERAARASATATTFFDHYRGWLSQQDQPAQ